MTTCVLGAGLVLAACAAPMTTPFGEKVTDDNCWRDYPRPQLVRDNWQCLNGAWDYVIVSNSLCSTNANSDTFPGLDVEVARGRIRVPFAFESALSGVGRTIGPNETMVYRRKFAAHPRPGYRTLLNFEGVDLRTQVFVNGLEATDVPNMGSETPFSVDVTRFVREGENDLRVVVYDPTDRTGGEFGAGKQSSKPHGCFYTRVSGIWQTVWTEEVPDTHVAGYRVTADIDAGTVAFRFDVASPKFAKDEVTVSVAGVTAKTKDGEVTLKLPAPVRLWSPETPELYDFTATCGADSFRGYFGMRKIERRRDANGVWRFFLNHRPYYPIGTLDQGWWPDGLLTPPSAEACEFDIRTLKRCGFNMMRKHIKVEPRVYYALCDRLGLLVLQDMPSGSPENTRRLFLSDEGDAIRMENRYAAYRREWKGVVDHLYNVPSVVMWIPYNESWMQPGERLTRDTLAWTKRYDPTRLVNGPSGWSDYEGGDLIEANSRLSVGREPRAEAEDPASDCSDRHDYGADAPLPLRHVRNRIGFLGEFGGIGLKIPGHLWNAEKSWGYVDTGKDTDRKATQAKYVALMDRLAKASEKCYSGAVYTQTTDVEIEINGLMTYDRRVLKFDPAVLKAAHDKVRAVAETAGPAAAATTVREPSPTTLIAHRGESVDAPENTLPAYRMAVDRGFGFECDIYLAKDGRLFTFHDHDLTRTTAGANTNRCTDVDWEGTVSKLNVGGWGKWKGSAYDPTRPALLSEVLALARDGRQIYVEVKDNDPTWVPYIKAEIERAKNVNPGNVLFISFGDKVLAELKRQLPQYRAYFLLGAYRDRERTRPWTADEIVARLREIGADGVDISFDEKLHDAAFVRKVRDAGFSFHVWTVDDLARAEKAFAAGVDTLTTNCAKKLLDGHNGVADPARDGGVRIADLAAAAAVNEWNAVPYETRDGIAGTMLSIAGTAPSGRRVEIPLKARGPHRIWLALGGKRWNGSTVRVRFKGERVGVRMAAQFPAADSNDRLSFGELEYREADLQGGETLVVENVTDSVCSLGWVRLEPIGSVTPPPDGPGMVTTNDSYAPYGTIEEFLEPFAHVANSPVKKVFFCVGNGAQSFSVPSKVAHKASYSKTHVYNRPIDRDIAKNLEILRRDHPNLLAEAIDYAHSLGLEFHVSFRTGCFVSDFGRNIEIFASAGPGSAAIPPSTADNACRLWDGTAVGRFSYARREVQDFFLRFYAEALDSKADGINLIFTRALPAMLFEPAFRERFAARYGEQLASTNDPRIVECRCEIMTDFFRRVRALAGKRPFSLTLLGSPALNKSFGIDVEGLARAGIVDEFIVDGDRLTKPRRIAFDLIDLEGFRAAVAGTKATYRVQLTKWWKGLDAKNFRTAAAAGSNSFSIWDGATIPWQDWERIRRYRPGDFEAGDRWVAEHSEAWRVHPLKTVNGIDYVHYPWWIAY